ncbi:alpha-ketoglutarate-dependent dioxygenase alkB homolog 4 [Teleopsis dalmanni]|uniref:alpha-ketoglutarate-dependent dioxygenase alkB homolog 4 n=1 Tax=Teleopsis dalmanni TaxID=139649 RepID=UPI0018CE9192|nr:alpha-ketoglutarate-dependent dioxygenase alkB homolog 4 [Teleopsis dalmanni]
MNTIRPCGCKGVRTCLQCESDYKIMKISLQEEFLKLRALSYCVECKCLYSGWQPANVRNEHPEHRGEEGIRLSGILVLENFLTPSEGNDLMIELDKLPWTVSQSGRRKQNYGPKTNFKKRKLRNGNFSGFPATTEYLQTRFKQIPLLRDFQSIEQCSLEYTEAKGACIDPHIDDCWIWGERVVTVNCLGSAVLTLKLYDSTGDISNRYNLDLVQEYKHKLISPLEDVAELGQYKDCVIRIPMPNLSLIVLYGAARYQFEHAVLREDITGRRVCLAYREFTPMYLKGGELEEEGNDITTNAKIFWNNNFDVEN